MARGFNARADVMRLADGTDTDQLWADYGDMLDLYNRARDGLVDLLSYRIVTPAEHILATEGGGLFEQASEYGEPTGFRLGASTVALGCTFRWLDRASRYTWQFLADASRPQADAVVASIMEADNRTVFRGIFRAAFGNTARANVEGHTVYPFHNGDDMVPPEFEGRTFASGHSHFVTTGSTALTSAAVDALLGLVTEHGWGLDGRGRLVLLVNPAQADRIRSFRVASGDAADFIAGAGAVPYLTDQTIVGERPPASIGAVEVFGSYSRALCVESWLVPAGYLLATVTSGANDQHNPIAFREHPNANMRGLLKVAGNRPDYPLTNSFFVRGFGTGVRKRSAGAAMQVTTNATYTPPTSLAGAV